MKQVIKTKDLSFWYGNKKVLDNVSIAVEEGKITAILGHSGSGKSTLLKIFNRMIDFIQESKIEGEVEVLGKDLYEWDPYELRKKVVMLFQMPNPFPHITIYENVAIAARVAGVARNKAEIEEIVSWALKSAALWDEVKDRLNDYPYKLSGGQQQRLCLARALVTKPKILLLDEPTTNVDVESTIVIEDTLKDIVKNLGITAVVVTHQPDQAVRISNYIVVINKGQVIEQGPTEEVTKHPKQKFTRLLFNGFLIQKD